MIERAFWQHLPTGNIWAVETDGRAPVRCAGPIDPRDVDGRLLPYLDYSTIHLSLLKFDWSSWVPYVVCSACGSVVRPGAATVANGADGRVHLACSLAPPSSGSDSVGAAILKESFWQSSARLRHTSRVLRQRSERLQWRCRAARASLTPAPVDACDTPMLAG